MALPGHFLFAGIMMSGTYVRCSPLFSPMRTDFGELIRTNAPDFATIADHTNIGRERQRVDATRPAFRIGDSRHDSARWL